LDRIQKQLSDVARLTGKEYIKARETVEHDYKQESAYIQHCANSATDWCVRAVAKIVVERQEKKDPIQAFLDWKFDVPYDRAATRRIRTAGSAIAGKAENIPMFLVEAFWKENELEPDPLKTKFFRNDPQWAFLANAIGQMKIGEARPILEKALLEDFYKPIADDLYIGGWKSIVKIEVAKALGEIKSADSVPGLLEVLEKDPDAKDRATLYALGALSSCIDKSSKKFLSQKLQESTEEKVKTTVARLLEQIDKSEK
jgi:hypothetical protein